MDTETRAQPRNRRRRVLAIVLGGIALLLIVGGAQLALLGGSIYYLAAGVAVAATAWLAYKGDRRDAAVYAALLVGTLVWAVWESGADVWALQSRLFAPIVLGLWVCWPQLERYRKSSFGVLAVAVIVFGGWLWQVNRVQIAPLVALAGSDGSGEWPQYGNDLGGTRFSPLSQTSKMLRDLPRRGPIGRA